MSTSLAAGTSDVDSRAALTLWNSLRSEWTKLRSLRSTAYLLAATVGVALVLTTTYSFVAAGEFHAPSGAAGPLDPSDPTGTALFSVLIAQLAIMALGALAITSEYATRTIQPSLTVQPRRGQLFAAKAVVTFTVSLVAGAVTGVAAFTVGQLILSSQGVPHATLGQPHVLRAVLGVGLYYALIGLLSLAVGTITRATSGALTIMIIGGLMLPNLVGLLPAPWDGYAQRYWPTIAGLQITKVESDPWNAPALARSWATGRLHCPGSRHRGCRAAHSRHLRGCAVVGSNIAVVLDVNPPDSTSEVLVMVARRPTSSALLVAIRPIQPRHRQAHPLRAEVLHAIELLRGSIATRWTLKMLAEEVHLSASQPSRVLLTPQPRRHRQLAATFITAALIPTTLQQAGSTATVAIPWPPMLLVIAVSAAIVLATSHVAGAVALRVRPLDDIGVPE